MYGIPQKGICHSDERNDEETFGYAMCDMRSGDFRF